jgi:Ca-activated chloride channel family protein
MKAIVRKGAEDRMIKQIILITDGCSNVGISPVVAAAHALVEGIVVNVIGIMDQGDLGEKGAMEVVEIAKAGGGLSRLVQARQLSQTIQMMTRQTVACTIRQTVQEELRRIMTNKQIIQLHSNPIDVLSPQQRERVIEVMDEMVETVSLRVGLLIDTSASMKSKWNAVTEAIHDLGLSLEARQGISEVVVYRFPGSSLSHTACEKILCHSNQLAKMGELFYNLEMKGTTPTGPALLEVVQDMVQSTKGSEITNSKRQTRDGLLSDYIV